jgi:hypothetical protein
VSRRGRFMRSDVLTGRPETANISVT